MHVVREVVDVGQAMADWIERVALDTRQGFKVHVIKTDVADVARLGAVFAAPFVDEVNDGVANALDGGDVQLARARGVGIAPGAQRNGALVSGLGVAHPERNGADAGAVLAGKALGKRVGLGVDDEVDAALAVQRDVFVAVPGNRLEAHAFKQRAHHGRVGRRVFNEFETVGAHGVVPGRACFER